MNMNYEMYFWIFFIALIILSIVIPIIWSISINNKIRDQIIKLADNALEVTPQQFFAIRNTSGGGRGKKHISTQYDFAGVYILYNHTKNMYYVGQGKKYFKE